VKHSAYKITFSSRGYPDVVVLHDEAPVVVSGYGGWTTTQRARRVSLTEWQGKDPLKMDVPILFDGLADKDGQEIAITTLSHMALPASEGSEPPVIAIDGPGVPEPGPQDWVIEGIDWGSNVVFDFNDNGFMVRMRQDAVVHLLQYVSDDRIAFKNVTLGSATKRGWPKSYTVKSGDTLQKIAARKDIYHDSTKWSKIATANGLRGSKPLKVGTKLRIPAP
jgi:hypothetical protein